MRRPSRDDFRSLARGHTVVPVWREILGDLITPVAGFARVVGDEPGFLFESVEHGERWSRWSFLGRRPLATMVLRDGRLDVDGELPASVPRDRGVLAAVEALLDAAAERGEAWTVPRLVEWLATERHVTISAGRLGVVLNARGFRWKRTKRPLQHKADPTLPERARGDLEVLRF